MDSTESTPDREQAPAEDHFSAAAAAACIPDHELIRRIGAGSYGDVWLAQTVLGQHRAVKIVFASRFPDQDPFQREFEGLRRYEPLSRSHPGLVVVFQVGRSPDNTSFYYVMEAADDIESGQAIDPDAYSPRTLESDLGSARIRLPLDPCYAIGEQLADAVGYLHAHSLLHRDLKPDNIIFVGGVPKIADVGLVADADGRVSMIGAPAYICPHTHGTPRGDIFALGKILYEMVTGKFASEFPELPDDLPGWPDGRWRAKFNPIWARACGPPLAGRYASASQMRQDLRRLREGKPIRRPLKSVLLAPHVAILAAFAAGACSFAAAVWFGHRHESTVPAAERDPVLLAEDFASPELDDALWTTNWTGAFSYTGTGTQQGDTRLDDGALVLETLAEHEGGWTSAAIAWADANVDLWGQGDLLLTATVSGEARNGVLGLMLCDGSDPATLDGLEAGALFSWHGGNDEGTALGSCAVRVEISESSRLALVEVSRLDRGVRTLNLAPTGPWHIRFFSFAHSSQGFRPGRARLRIEEVRVAPIPRQSGVLGHIVDAVSLRGIRNAVIRDSHGREVARTHRDGSFRAELPAGTHILNIDQTGYAATHTAPVVVTAGHRARVTATMTRDSYVLGDVLAAIDCEGRGVSAIEATDDALYLAAQDPERGPVIFRTSLDGTDWQLVAAIEPVSGMAAVDGILYASSVWPGQIRRINPDGPDPILAELSPLEWPYDLTFDGERFWFVERSIDLNRRALYAYDLQHGTVSAPIHSSDSTIRGLAWDGQRLWVACSAGYVVAVDPEAAAAGGSLRAGEVARFEGHYVSLAYADGFLYGLDQELQRICKIKQ